MIFKAGQRVIVKSLNEIFTTLDNNGCLEGIPFMPEMIKYCDKEFSISKRADRTCIEPVEIRQLTETVFLENLRCGGEFHGECQKGCMFFWKEAWLKNPPESENHRVSKALILEPNLITMTGNGLYICQSTELKRATKPLAKWSSKRIFGEYTTGNVTLERLVCFIALPAWVRFQRLLSKTKSIRPSGECANTPIEVIGLHPGDLVEIKNRREIEATLNPRGRNRGLEFTLLMVPYCGRRFRVRNRVQRMILETTGEMIELENTVILEGATCDGHTILGGCPRDTFHLWREVWLKRIESTD